MDVQRAKKKGRANYFVVAPITAAPMRSALRGVQADLEAAYPTARAELRKGFTNMDSAEVHVTLFAIHANQQRLQQVLRALAKFAEERKDDLSFALELKGLGSWTSKAGNIILYADLSRDSASTVRALAKRVRDFVLAAVMAEEAALRKEAEADGEVGEAVEGVQALSVEAKQRAAPSAAGGARRTWKHDEEEGEGESGNESDGDEADDDADEDDDEDDDEEEEEEEDAAEDLPGLWFDDPRPDIYVPHVTVLNSDPAWDRKLRLQLADKKEARGARQAKAMKRGGGKGRAAAEPFGWDYALFRSLRSDYNKFSFGSQPVAHLELQSEFVCVHRIPLR